MVVFLMSTMFSFRKTLQKTTADGSCGSIAPLTSVLVPKTEEHENGKPVDSVDSQFSDIFYSLLSLFAAFCSRYWPQTSSAAAPSLTSSMWNRI